MLCQFGSTAAQLAGSPKLPAEPLFTVLMPMGTVVPGIRAMFSALLLKGPLMPGPLRKKPNTSLKVEHTYSLYSSLPKTKRNFRESPAGTKSNSSTALSFTFCWEMVSRSMSPVKSGEAGPRVSPSLLFGPTTSSMLPLHITRP